MITLSVDLEERSYPIYIGEHLLGDSELLRQHIPGKNVLVVSNETVAPLYLDNTLAMLAGKHVETCILPDGEEYKTLDTLNRIYDVLLGKKLDRNSTIVALGGGVIGDMAGFAVPRRLYAPVSLSFAMLGSSPRAIISSQIVGSSPSRPSMITLLTRAGPRFLRRMSRHSRRTG